MKRLFIVLIGSAAASCSTVGSRLADSPDYVQTTPVALAAFEECFVRATAKEDVSYLPRQGGGMFKSTGGPQDYVFWLVTVEDLGSARRVTVHAVNSKIAEKVALKARTCM